MSKALLLILGMIIPSVGMAGTDCNEWATMTQILVIRWQGDATFQNKTVDDVKKELDRTMGGHPELEKAKGYVDIAYKRRNDNPVHVWKETYAKCNAVSI